MTRRGAYRAGQPGVALGTLGQRIRAIRKAWGWTQRELAALLHVPQASISQWEVGRTRPIGPVLAHLLQVFSLSEEALMDGTGFTIPSLIEESRKPSIAFRTADTQEERVLSLPAASNGELWRIEIGDSEAEPERMTLQQATRYLKAISNDGGAVWIVARSVKLPI